ncbi:MAG: hypothetical protein RBR14_07750 [Candidatus Cloacimonas acidaminovorans]|nr:hypothetical protein [Candidatus Cloacimonas acidaminovorans]HOU69284.1 hypothetical protein [Paludibacteraceae bacterium]
MFALELIPKAIAVYKKRWAIEAVHRQMKQSKKWETMRLELSMNEKSNATMALALFFINVSKKYIEKIALGFPKILPYNKVDNAMPKEFIYYSIVEVITVCINFIISV